MTNKPITHTRCHTCGVTTIEDLDSYISEVQSEGAITHEGKTYYPDERGWYDIACAPRDGTLIDIFIPELEERYPDSYYNLSKKVFCWNILGTGEMIYFNATPPTYWRPLPEPPIANDGGQE